MLIQLAFVLIAIIIGARLGGIGLGVLGGLGLAVLTFVFGLEPTSPPIDVMLMIVAVIAAASCMQAAGGLDLMVKWAEKLLRKNPSKITILSPLVTYVFTFIAGTGHVAYSVLPVIAEVATETKIRPERPLGIAVIASQQAITASPISAATVALLSMLVGQGFNVTLFDILMISVPCTLAGVLAGAFYSLRVGKELEDDPEFKRRIAEGEFTTQKYELKDVKNQKAAGWSVIIFILATIGIILSAAMLIYTSVKPYPMDVLPDGTLLVDPWDMVTDCYKAAGAMMGFCLGWVLERHFVGFDAKGAGKARVIRGVVGVALLLAVRKGLKAAGNLLLDAHWLGFAEMFGLMLFAIVLYPALFQWAERRKSKS